MSLADEARGLKPFGYVPVEDSWPGLVTYQFLHGGWLYLVGNMLFLYLAGSSIEPRWGHALHLALYLSAGVVAALADKLAGPHSLMALFGASGAVAGLMGAFLLKFLASPIKLPLSGFFRPQAVTFPAYLLLPPWLLVQLLCGVASSGAGAQGGVTLSAVIGSFVYGALLAVALGLSGLDARLDPPVAKAG